MFGSMRDRAWLVVIALAAASVAGCAGGAAPAAQSPVTSAPCAAAPADGFDQLSDEALVRKLLVATGAANAGKQILNGTLEAFRKMPNLPDGFIDRFQQNVDPDQLTELIVPIYLKHYDHATLLAALRFYESEPGRAMVAKLPTVTAESMTAGRVWGKTVAEKTLAEMGLSPANP